MKKITALLLALIIILGTNFAFAADVSGTPIEKGDNWKITSDATVSWGDVKNAFDGKLDTMWHTYFAQNADGGMVYEKEGHHITVDFGEKIKVSGLMYTPRTDNKSGVVTEFEVYASDDGTNFKQIYTGSFDFGEEYSDLSPGFASWGNVEMKAIKFLVKKSYANHGTCSELQFYTGGTGSTNGNGSVLTDKAPETSSAAEAIKGIDESQKIKIESSWVITADSSTKTAGPEKAFDGKTDTHWHTNYGVNEGKIVDIDPPPHNITVDFGKEIELSGLIFTPRPENAGGTITRAGVYLSSDGKNFEKVTEATFVFGSKDSDIRLPQLIGWTPQKARALKFEAIECRNGIATVAELTFLTGDVEITKTAESEESAKAPAGKVASNGIAALTNRNDWEITASSEQVKGNVKRIIDGDDNTYWHSWYASVGSTITERDTTPYYIDIVLPEPTLISGVIFTPRSDNKSGRISCFNLKVAENDTDELYTILENYETEMTEGDKELLFASNILVKRMQIEITASYAHYGTLCEFNILPENKNNKTVEYEAFAEEELKNKMFPLEREGFILKSETPVWGDHIVETIIDGDKNTFWQTNAVSAGETIVLSMDLGTVTEFSAIEYTPRQTTDFHGFWKNFSIYASEDGENYEPVLKNITLPVGTSTCTIDMPQKVKARYVEFEIHEGEADRASCAEVNFLLDYEAYNKYIEDYEKTRKEEYILKIDSNIIGVTRGENTYEKQIDVAPYIVNGSTMIPLRGLVEEMGGEILWDGGTQTITIKKGNDTIWLQIWNRQVYIEGVATARRKVRHTILNFPVIKDGRTFIPIRFVSEQLGYNVSWDGETRTVTITE